MKREKIFTFKQILIANIVLAILYYFSGKLARLLSLPPGIACAMWPGAGIALAYFIHYGPSVSIGLYLGAFLINHELSGANAQALTTWEANIVPLMISFSAILHPLVSTHLIKLVGISVRRLVKANEIFTLIVIGGILGTIISSTIGVMTLYYFKVLSLELITEDWLVWWLGDFVGVLIFTPITLLSLGNFHKHYVRFSQVVIPVFIFLIISISLFYKFKSNELEKFENEFNVKSSKMQSALKEAFNNHVNIMMSIKFFYESSSFISREEFYNYTRMYINSSLGVQSIQWVPFVKKDKRSEFETEMSRYYRDSLFIKVKEANDFIVSPVKEFYYPISYVEPYEGNSIVLGYDIYSDISRQGLLDDARENNAISSSNVIKLIQDYNRRPGVVFSVPIFKEGRGEFLGFVSGVFKIKEILTHALRDLSVDEIDYLIYLNNEDLSDSELYLSSFKSLDEIRKNSIFKNTYKFSIAGREWSFNTYFSIKNLMKKKYWSLWALLTVALMFSGIFGIILLIITGQNELVQIEVKQKTKDFEAKNKELIELNERMETVSSYKSEFLANMSHEIRTPLNGIIGMLHLLEDDNLTSDQKSNLDTIKVASESLTTIINDILDFSKIEAGKLNLEFINFDLKTLVEIIVKLHQKEASKKGVEFKLEFSENFPPYIRSDKTRISQVLNNLLSNAVKFTERGMIKINIRAEEFDNQETLIYFSVKDSGIGIDKEKIDSLFKPFSQGDTSTTRKYGGTGLGLVISKKLAQMLGGDITVVSEIGRGSGFVFNIFTTKVSFSSIESEEKIESNHDFSKISVLVCEDNKINQKVINSLLNKLGPKVQFAENGIMAIKICEKEKFDLIFMDLQMPQKDGFEASLGILEKGLNTTTPIVAMTANVFQADRQKCFEHGMKDFVEKPIKIHEVVRVLGKIVKKSY